MHRKNPSGIKYVCLRLTIILFLFHPISSTGQNSLEVFLDSALVNNPEAASIHTQIRSYKYDDQMITAILQSPKAYMSSELLVAPYLNNNGNIIDVAPSDKAIGYDIGITNGGLYSLLFNLELPLMKGKQVIHLQEQTRVEVEKLKTRLSLIEAELRRSIGGMYFDVLAQQASVESNRQNTALLNEEFQLIKALTSKGLFRISDYKMMELELKADSIDLNTSVNELVLAVRQLKAACGIHNRDISVLINPQLVTTEPISRPSLFIRPYAHDSLATISQQKVFNDRYLLQLSAFANSGLNSNSIPNMQRHVGMSAGLLLTYNLFDGHQKKINEDQQLLRIDEAMHQKGLKLNEVKNQADALLQNISKVRNELIKQKQIQIEYKELLELYQDEVKRAQMSVIDLITFLKKYSSINLAVRIKEITLNKLINEYNYWNQ